MLCLSRGHYFTNTSSQFMLLHVLCNQAILPSAISCWWTWLLSFCFNVGPAKQITTKLSICSSIRLSVHLSVTLWFCHVCLCRNVMYLFYLLLWIKELTCKSYKEFVYFGWQERQRCLEVSWCLYLCVRNRLKDPLLPLPCGAGSTVPRERFDSSVIMPFPGVLWLWHFLYSVGQHPVSSLHIYTFVVSRAFMAGAAAKQETLTPPGHLVSPLVCRGPWMSIVVLYCCATVSSFVFYTYDRDVLEQLFYSWIITEFGIPYHV